MSSCLYPCPCGYWGDPTAPRNCSCSPTIVTRYQKRISGPPRVDYEKLASDRASESSEVVRQRVRSACEKQLARFDGSGLTCNADTPALPQMTETSCAAGGCERCKCGPGAHPESCELDDTSKALMRSAMNQLGMSARAFHRVLKLSRTIADLAGADAIRAAHPAEAIHLQSTEKAELTAPLRPDLADRSLKGAVLDFQRQLSELKPKEPLRHEQEHRYGNL